MSEHWPEISLSQLATVTMGQSPEASCVSSDERGLPFLQGCAEFGARVPSPKLHCSPPLRVAKAGSVLISVRAPVGTTNFADQDYCIGRGLGAVTAKPESADNIFLFHAIGQNVGFLHRRSQGSTFLAIGSKDLSTLPVPALGLSTQRRIAEILSTVDEAIEQTEALIAKYQQIKEGLMHDLFTRGVTPDGHLRPTRGQAPLLYKESPLGWIPKEWDIVSVRGCGSVQLGRQRSPDQMSGRWTMPYLRVANVFDGYIDYSDVLEMDFTPDERRTFSLKQGDILLNEGQSLELVGRCALYDGQDDAFCFQNTLVRFRPFDKQCPFFYRFLFKWFLDCGLFMRIAKQTTSVAHLGAGRFARMRCISVPYDEQLRIAERLGILQARLDSDMAHASKLCQQKQGLMQDLLTGRVRVTVGESASA